MISLSCIRQSMSARQLIWPVDWPLKVVSRWCFPALEPRLRGIIIQDLQRLSTDICQFWR